LVENRDFSYILAFDAPVKGVAVGILRYRLVRKNPDCCGYPVVKKLENMCNHFDRISACDRQRDRQTDILRRRSPRYA